MWRSMSASLMPLARRTPAMLRGSSTSMVPSPSSPSTPPRGLRALMRVNSIAIEVCCRFVSAIASSHRTTALTIAASALERALSSDCRWTSAASILSACTIMWSLVATASVFGSARLMRAICWAMRRRDCQYCIIDWYIIFRSASSLRLVGVCDSGGSRFWVVVSSGGDAGVAGWSWSGVVMRRGPQTGSRLVTGWIPCGRRRLMPMPRGDGVCGRPGVGCGCRA